jgi:hypothetical protein
MKTYNNERASVNKVKNILNISGQNEILQRLAKLHAASQNMVGKMSPTQMLAHCTKPMQVAMGDAAASYKLLEFLKMFSKKGLRRKNFNKNLPDTYESGIAEQRKFIAGKMALLAILEKLNQEGTSAIQKDKLPYFLFSGRMSIDEWGHVNYTHLDHHFKQFGI